MTHNVPEGILRELDTQESLDQYTTPTELPPLYEYLEEGDTEECQ